MRLAAPDEQRASPAWGRTPPVAGTSTAVAPNATAERTKEPALPSSVTPSSTTQNLSVSRLVSASVSAKVETTTGEVWAAMP